MNKRLKKLSAVLFNVFVVLFVIECILSTVGHGMEETLTEYVFGGYQKVVEDYSDNTMVYPSAYKSVAQVKAAANNVANAVESEGAVLLKNEDNALPLSKGSIVSLYSISSILPLYTGAGGAIIHEIGQSDRVTFPMALKEAGLNYNTALYSWYESATTYGRKNASGNNTVATIDEVPWDVVDNSAKTQKADAGIFVLSRVGTEAKDLKEDYLRLDEDEKTVLSGMKALKDSGVLKHIIVLVNSANTLDNDFIDDAAYGIDAVLWIGLPGTSGLYGVCDILVGDVTPSGRLSDTWYNSNAYNPAAANYGDFSHDDQKYVVYQEGVYLGYRYTETRYEDVVTQQPNAGAFDYYSSVKYPFGYGLSYTQFQYSDFNGSYDSAKDEFAFSVNVTNKGTIAGKEVVQLYMQSPYTAYDKENHIEKSAVELVGFAKTQKLKAGESETVTITVDGRLRACYDAYGKGTYFLDAGDYYFTAARNAHDAVNNILSLKGYDLSDGMTETGVPEMVFADNVSTSSATKYATKIVNGNSVEIGNLFDFGDINRLNDGVNHVNYFSRADWQGTLPATGADGKYTKAMHAVVNSSAAISLQRSTDKGNAIMAKDKDGNDKVFTLDEVKDDGREYPTYNKNSGLLWQNMRKNDNGLIAYDDPLWDAFLDQLTFEQTCQLLTSGFRKTPTVNGADTNGFVYPGTYEPNGPNGITGPYNNVNGVNGLATVKKDPDGALATTAYPCQGILASTFNTLLAEVCGQSYGEEALWAGANGVYAFTVNLHRYATHGRASESYSEDAMLTAIISGYQAKGCQSKGLYVYTKHLVLNEQETNRKTHESWITEQALRELYLKAFEVSIDIGGGKCVMTSFAKIGGVWSGHNKNLLTNWLRGECGLVGFAVTDSYTASYMSMRASVLCGQDLPDGSCPDELNYAETGASAVAWAMREAAHRIMYTTVHSNRVNGLSSDKTANIVVLKPTWITVLDVSAITVYMLAALSTVLFVTVVAVDLCRQRQKDHINRKK